MDSIIQAVIRVRAELAWIPDWVIGLVLAAIAIPIALFVHAVCERILRRIVGTRTAFWTTLIPRTRNLLRAVFLLIAVNFVIQSPLFPPKLNQIAAQVIWVAVIILFGWTTLIAIDVAATRHVRNYRLDVADNLLARKHMTQIRILKRVVNVVVVIITAAVALMTFDSVRQFGVSLFASAGAAGLVVGLAARPVLSNLIAGLQLAITQPIRIDDVLVLEGEFGRVEEINGSFVVIKLWDWRRMVVPLSYFIEKPFQNWTRTGASVIGAVMFQLDYTVPVDAFRKKAEEVVKASALWDKQVVNVQVSDSKDATVELRILCSAGDSGRAWDLRCEVREKMLAFLQAEHPQSLPRRRHEILGAGGVLDRVAPKPAEA
jgi:small-conductance mechanosensitive channel